MLVKWAINSLGNILQYMFRDVFGNILWYNCTETKRTSRRNGWLMQDTYFSFSLLVQFNIVFKSTFPKSVVGSQYFTLNEVKPYARDVEPPIAFSGWMS